MKRLGAIRSDEESPTTGKAALGNSTINLDTDASLFSVDLDSDKEIRCVGDHRPGRSFVMVLRNTTTKDLIVSFDQHFRGGDIKIDKQSVTTVTWIDEGDHALYRTAMQQGLSL